MQTLGKQGFPDLQPPQDPPTLFFTFVFGGGVRREAGETARGSGGLGQWACREAHGNACWLEAPAVGSAGSWDTSCARRCSHRARPGPQD